MLAQVAIDNAKRKFDVNLSSEISRIKELVEVKSNGVPAFWQITKKDKTKSNSDEQRKAKAKANKDKVSKMVNHNLVCPMNYLYNITFDYHRDENEIIPISKFVDLNLSDNNRRKSKKVEELIEKYSIDLHNFYMNHSDGTNWSEDDEIVLMMEKFDELISDIRKINISSNYKGLMSYLINRAFCIGAGVKSKKEVMDSNTNKNKALLLKVLYTVNPKTFLSCFKEKVYND